MKYIDKSLKRSQGEAIVTEFLNCFLRRLGTFPDDMYNAFSKEIDDNHNHIKFLQRLKDEVLMPEQDGHCCYCMRNLKACRRITVEHIMPNHADNKEELDMYRKKPTELDGLPHSEDFKKMEPITFPPHPHSIAYQNLVLSCDGDLFKENSKAICCNLKRMHKFLLPFILYPDITKKFVYTMDGMAEWTEDPEPPESKGNAMKILGLNNQVLRMVRRIWFFCNDNHLNPLQEDKRTIINNMMGHFASSNATESEINMLLNFKKDKYWNLIREYDAFHKIQHN